MKHRAFVFALLLVGVIGLFHVLNVQQKIRRTSTEERMYTSQSTTQKESALAHVQESYQKSILPIEIESLKNSTFTIDGTSVTLMNGFAETESAPGSAQKNRIRYFGNESKGDLDGNGHEDIAFMVTQEAGGSGMFYYVVVSLQYRDMSLKTNSNGEIDAHFKNTQAFFVGDRIAPQGTKIQSDARELSVFLAERKKDEPFSVAPSQGAVLLLKVNKEGELEGLMK